MSVFRLLAWLINLVVGLAMLGGLVGGVLMLAYYKPGPLSDSKTVVIERGSGLPGIAAQLNQAGVIDNPPAAFTLGVLLTGKRGLLKAGEYEFPAQISMAQVAELMAKGQVVVHKVTVVDGTTVKDVLAQLAAEPALTGEISQTPPEGTLLPETYFFNRGDTRDELLKRMQAAGQEALEKAWASRAPDLPVTSKLQVLTLASIIEKETGVPAERARVAGVFVNRLRQGMKLQSDPTAIYPLSNQTGDLGRALTLKDLELASPYNTYYAPGLPPGPIANPGLAALMAAVKPEGHDYLYFVADGSGGHAFASTLEAHNRNVAKWRQLQRGQ